MPTLIKILLLFHEWHRTTGHWTAVPCSSGLPAFHRLWSPTCYRFKSQNGSLDAGHANSPAPCYRVSHSISSCLVVPLYIICNPNYLWEGALPLILCNGQGRNLLSYVASFTSHLALSPFHSHVTHPIITSQFLLQLQPSTWYTNVNASSSSASSQLLIISSNNQNSPKPIRTVLSIRDNSRRHVVEDLNRK